MDPDSAVEKQRKQTYETAECYYRAYVLFELDTIIVCAPSYSCVVHLQVNYYN